MQHLRWLLFLPVTAVVWGISCSSSKRIPELKAIGGVLDLSQHDFQSDPVVTLGGEWLYYSGQLVTDINDAKKLTGTPVNVPQTWPGDGFGTYHLHLKLPALHEIVKLHMQAQLSAYDVYISGLLRAASGRPGRSGPETTPATKPLKSAGCAAHQQCPAPGWRTTFSGAHCRRNSGRNGGRSSNEENPAAE